MGEKWDLQGIYIGITWELLGSCSEENEKKNFYITLQLVTHSVVKIYVLEIYGGDSFRFTRHPLITTK